MAGSTETGSIPWPEVQNSECQRRSRFPHGSEKLLPDSPYYVHVELRRSLNAGRLMRSDVVPTSLHRAGQDQVSIPTRLTSATIAPGWPDGLMHHRWSSLHS